MNHIKLYKTRVRTIKHLLVGGGIVIITLLCFMSINYSEKRHTIESKKSNSPIVANEETKADIIEYSRIDDHTGPDQNSYKILPKLFNQSPNQKKFDSSEHLNGNTTLKIDQSIFQGFTKDLSPYRIIANQVVSSASDCYLLKLIQANYQLEEGLLNVNSLKGKLDNTNNKLILFDNINISWGDVILTTELLNIDIKENNAQTNQPVRVNYRNSQVISDQMNTKDAVDVIVFEGNVKSKFKLSDFECQLNH